MDDGDNQKMKSRREKDDKQRTRKRVRRLNDLNQKKEWKRDERFS